MYSVMHKKYFLVFLVDFWEPKINSTFSVRMFKRKITAPYLMCEVVHAFLFAGCIFFPSEKHDLL